MAANPMANRSAALAGAAQALSKPKMPGGGRQDLSGAKDGVIQGAHGGIQQLGEAAKRRLSGGMQPGQSPPIVAPNTAGGGLNPDAQKPGNVGLPPTVTDKPMALPGFMSAMPKPDPGMQIFDGGAKLPMEAPGMAGGGSPIPPEMAQMLSDRLSPGGMGNGAPDLRGVRDQMMGAGAPQFGGVHSTGGGALPGFAAGGGMTLNGPPMQAKPAFDPVAEGMQAGPGPMGAIPGARPKPGMPGLPTKPMEMETDPAATGRGGGIWNRIAGGGGFREGLGRPRDNMATY